MIIINTKNMTEKCVVSYSNKTIPVFVKPPIITLFHCCWSLEVIIQHFRILECLYSNYILSQYLTFTKSILTVVSSWLPGHQVKWNEFLATIPTYRYISRIVRGTSHPPYRILCPNWSPISLAHWTGLWILAPNFDGTFTQKCNISWWARNEQPDDQRQT